MSPVVTRRRPATRRSSTTLALLATDPAATGLGVGHSTVARSRPCVVSPQAYSSPARDSVTGTPAPASAASVASASDAGSRTGVT